VALLSLLLALALAAAVAVAVALVRRSPTSAEGTVTAARRHARLTSTAAVTLAALCALVSGATDPLAGTGASSVGRQALLVPIWFGVAHTVVLALGELTWPRPAGRVRRARLVRRGLLDAAPRWLRRLGSGAAVAAALTIAGGALTAAPDGRGFAVTGADGRVASTAGPFAGPAYGVPAAVGLLVLAGVVVATLWIVADRPAVVTEDERIEAALRRASAHRVLRGAAAATLFVTGGLLAVSGQAVHGAASSAAATAAANGLPTSALSTQLLPPLGIAIAVLGLLAALAGVVLLAVRAPGVPADRASSAVPAG
jgi:hypothetical protein